MANNKDNKNSDVGLPSNGMRVCYLNHDLQNETGAGRFFLSLFGEMKKLLPEAKFNILISEQVNNISKSDIDTLPILQPNKFRLLFALLKIRRIFKKCDVIHALDGWPYGVIAALASIGLKKKLILTAIGTGAIQPLYNFWKRPLMKWAYKKADAVTAISNHTKKEILKIIPDLKIDVINHGVDAKKFEISNYKFETNLKSKIQNYKPYILSVGALKKRKGFEHSIKAFAEIAPKFPDFKYVIVGNGPEHQNLKFKIKNLKLDDRIIFLNNLSEEELITLYKEAELFILLPQDDGKDIEGFGLVFLEAAAAGLPVIATKDTSAEDAVLNNKNGILVSKKDFSEAARAMEKLLNNSGLKKTFSEESINFAKTMSWQKAAKSYILLYK